MLLEERNRREDEAKQAELALKNAAGVGLFVGLGALHSAVGVRVSRGGPEAVAAYGTFCAGYTAGDLIVRPVLHKLFPVIFPE
jgi:hypothetical protein